MTAVEFLHALDDFNQWYGDQRRVLIERGASAETLKSITHSNSHLHPKSYTHTLLQSLTY